MKMRKILSFVLVLSLVLGSFSMAFAATPATGLSDIAGVANEEAIQVNFDLGIITGNPDGTFLPEKAVNRAEFAAMMTRALAVPASALAGYTSTTFKDTVGYGWAVPYLAFCQSKGIMIGDGFGNVMPGRTINVNEAMTMVLRAVGYTENSSMLVGTWPSKYVTVAQNLSLYDDVATAVNVDKANAAQIIYNALTVEKVTVNADGTTEVLEGTTLLNTGLDCDFEEEIVVYDADSLVSLTKYVGANANVYRNDGGNGDIVAVEVLSTFLTGEYVDGTFEANDGVDYNVRLDVDEAYAVTNAAVAATSDDAIDLLGIVEDTYTIAVDKSGKTITEIYTVANWVVSEHDFADANTQDEITDDQELLGETFYVDVNDEIARTAFELVGVATLSDIKTDDVVYVYTLGNDLDEDIVKVAVGTDVVEGVATRVSSDTTEVTLDGKVYGYASDNVSGVTDAGDVAAHGDIVAGDEVELTLDAYGYIYSTEETSGTADDYAVVLERGNATESIGSTPQIKLFTADGAAKIFDVDDSEVTNYITNGVWTEVGVTPGAVIEYGLNKDGEIDEIQLVDSDNTTGDVNVATVESDVDISDKGYVGISGDLVTVDSVIFTFNGTSSQYDDEDEYDVTTATNVMDSTANIAYAATDKEVEVMIMSGFTTSDDTYGVVTGYATIDADYEYEVTALFGATEVTKLSDFAGVTSNSLVLYSFSFDADGAISDMDEVVTSDSDDWYVTTAAVGTTATAISGYILTDSDGTDFRLDSGVVVYTWDTDEFEVGAMRDLDGLLTEDLVLYDIDEDGAYDYVTIQ